MGKMAFPEDDLRPRRTVTATKIGSSREALIYKSGYARLGAGEYRTATVREAACLMGFPITYQFKGSEGTKWRLVGNAVCPSVSRSLARQVRNELGLEAIDSPILQKDANLKEVENLNAFVQRKFDSPPKRRVNSRFRRHPFKDGNITVTLSNYDIEKSNGDVSTWITSVQYGCGDGFPTFRFGDDFHEELEPLVRAYGAGPDFITRLERDLLSKTAPSCDLQTLYEEQRSTSRYLEPTKLVDELAALINQFDLEKQYFKQNGYAVFKDKKAVPAKQLFALYAINRLSSKANA
jgi:DNA (cytosine-5)-methyltransferase 1